MLPIILMHGIFGFGTLQFGQVTLRYFGRIAQRLESSGHAVLCPSSHPTAAIATRAELARNSIIPWLDKLKAERAIIIVHSMGGLDARHMLAGRGIGDRIAALVTIGTPHRGSPWADFLLSNATMRDGVIPAFGRAGLDLRGGLDLTREACARFNDQTPDAPGTRYFSITGTVPAGRVPLALLAPWKVVQAMEGENDGLVSVRSATWGEHMENWPVHHLHEVNRRFLIDLRSPVGDISEHYLKVVRRVESIVTAG